MPLKQRDRWNIVGALAAHGDPSAHELLDAETRRDNTDDGHKYAWVSGAAFATPEAKKKYFAAYLASAGVKEDWITASLPMFNYWSQAELTSPFLEAALAALPQLKRTGKSFLWSTGSTVSSAVSTRARRWKRSTAFCGRIAPIPTCVKILEVRDELARTVRVREAQ